MTRLEKQREVKDVLYHMCAYGDGCSDCRFFNPEDDTDGDYFCAIRDHEERIPTDDAWCMQTAMLSDKPQQK